ncbi:MAG TPA: hypothetical protein VGG61_01925, partial [Gemmataceae bacterium]
MRMLVGWLMAAMCATTGYGWASLSTADAGRTLAPAPCNLAGVPAPARCGTLAVPENRSKSPGHMISLNVVVLPSDGDRTLPPLYSLEGGPGIAATNSAGFWATAGSIHRQHRDIVLI